METIEFFERLPTVRLNDHQEADVIFMFPAFWFLLGLVVQNLETLESCSSLPSNVGGSSSRSSCRATKSGGGPSTIGTSGSLNLTLCIFEDYTSLQSFGGVARVEGSVVASDSQFIRCKGGGPSVFHVEGTVDMTNCIFEQNSQNGERITTWASEKWGFGCIGLVNSARRTVSVKLLECQFRKNENGCVAGVYHSGTAKGDLSFSVESCTFTDNYFTEAVKLNQVNPCETGGNILVSNGTCTVIGCTFQNTEAVQNGDGWAIVVLSQQKVTVDDPVLNVTDSVFINGAAEKGKASIYVYDEWDKPVKQPAPIITLGNCSFEGDCLHIQGPSGGIDITVEEACVRFANSATGAVKNVNFVSGLEGVLVDDLVAYEGGECGVPGPDSPTEDPESSEEPDPEGSASDSDPVVPTETPTDDDDDDDDDDSKDGKQLSGGEIAAIVIVVLIVIAALVAVLLFFLVFRRRYGPNSSTGEGASSEVTTTEEVVTGTDAVNRQYGGGFGLWDGEAHESD